MTTFLRLMDVAVEEKPKALRDAVGNPLDARVFDVIPSNFAIVPGSPFAYWVTQSLRSTFVSNQKLEGEARTAKRGPSTSDDTRYVRCWWEVPLNRKHVLGEWREFAKGGAFSKFFADVHLVVDWEERRTTFSGFLGRPGREIEKVESSGYFFRPGLTWPLRTNGLSFRVMPRGCVFGHKGPAAFVEGDDPAQLLALAALMNSKPFGYLVSVQLARTELAQSYEVGLIQQTPIPDLSDEDTNILAHLARRAWSLKRSLDTVHETSHAFVLPPGLHEKVTGLDPEAIQHELGAIQRDIDDRAFALYGISAEDRATIEGGNLPTPPSPRSEAELERGVGGVRSGEVDEPDDDGQDELASHALLSWLVGVAFGRFDPRIATGERGVPPEPEPFDALPARSPAMWPAEEQPEALAILVDDPRHREDLCAHVEAAAARTGCSVPEELRGWLAREFFPLHVKTYSKSRRKAPLYWQLATSSGNYSVWIYVHAFTKDTLYRVQREYVVPKVELEERRLEALRKEVGHAPKAEDRKRLSAQETFVEELRTMVEEVKRVAPLWNPNLDDGVIINFAPLWRLVSHCKPWQKELKATWDALVKGEYDWAHLSMHVWPERVVPKCASDRSLAIAHGLEEVFWVEGGDGKWKARGKATRPVEEMVQERTSAAVKAAVNSLAQTGSSGTGVGGRKKGRGTGR